MLWTHSHTHTHTHTQTSASVYLSTERESIHELLKGTKLCITKSPEPRCTTLNRQTDRGGLQRERERERERDSPLGAHIKVVLICKAILPQQACTSYMHMYYSSINKAGILSHCMYQMAVASHTCTHTTFTHCKQIVHCHNICPTKSR